MKRVTFILEPDDIPTYADTIKESSSTPFAKDMPVYRALSSITKNYPTFTPTISKDEIKN